MDKKIYANKGLNLKNPTAMQRSALLTSFTTWKPHHVTNSSDDLLAELTDITTSSLNFLRKIPVDFQLAPRQVLDRFNKLKPEILICCGMAERTRKAKYRI